MAVRETDEAARAAMAHVAALSSGGPLDRELRVTVHFHPDLLSGNSTVLEAIACDGIYRSQFETGVGNGGLTAHRGGARWRWESRMFGGHYDAAPAEARPKYGSLNRHRDPYGGSPRFGSCYFRLSGHTLDRTTFCFPDSAFEPGDFGTARRTRLLELAERAELTDPLDHYIEAHLHGEMSLHGDVEALVLDPCYRDTRLHDVAAELPCPLEWHGGYALGLDQLRAHSDYRGHAMIALGETLADTDGLLTPRLLGAARPTADPVELKQLWHCLARYGRREPVSVSRRRRRPWPRRGGG